MSKGTPFLTQNLKKEGFNLKGIRIGNKESKYPIIQGGMGVGVSMHNLAGNVSKEGGIEMNYPDMKEIYNLKRSETEKKISEKEYMIM